jgi:hypothetical protein
MAGGRERPYGPARTRAESCTGPVGRARSARIGMVRAVAEFVAGGTRIDAAEEVDVSYPGFFPEIAGEPVA